MEKITLAEEIGSVSYPGRGIVIGLTPDGQNAAIAYFIMGRSVNSRNRIFVEDNLEIRTEAYDPSKLEDPSLIIYAPVRVLGTDTIVTNGDQTDTIYDLMSDGRTFEQALRTREFEPDAPNYTPRISAILHLNLETDSETGSVSERFSTSTNQECPYSYQMSILKSNNGDPSTCNRYTFSYDVPLAGEAHYIHTYMGDGNPLPSYEGEPTILSIDTNSLDEFTDTVWNALNEDNKVSLFTRFINIKTGDTDTRIEISSMPSMVINW